MSLHKTPYIPLSETLPGVAYLPSEPEVIEFIDWMVYFMLPVDERPAEEPDHPFAEPYLSNASNENPLASDSVDSRYVTEGREKHNADNWHISYKCQWRREVGPLGRRNRVPPAR